PELRATGADVLRAVLGRRPEARVALAGQLDVASLARLRSSGVDRLVVGRDTLVPRPAVDGRVPVDQHIVTVPADQREFDSAVVDADLTAMVTGPTGRPVEAAQWALALLAVTADPPEP